MLCSIFELLIYWEILMDLSLQKYVAKPLLGVAQMQRIQFSAKLVRFKGFGFYSRTDWNGFEPVLYKDGWMDICMYA